MYDILMLAILVIAAVRGAIKGIVWQLAIIAALVLCFAFSEMGSALVAPQLPIDPPLNRWVAMLILYIVLSFAAFGVARLLHGWIEKAKFKEYDRHLGFLFGAVKGLIICLVLTFFVVTMSGRLRDSVMTSRSGYVAAVIMDRLHPVMPDELHEVLEPYIHRFDRSGMDLRYSHHDDEHSQNTGDTDHADDHVADASPIDKLLEAVEGAERAGIVDILETPPFDAEAGSAEQTELLEEIAVTFSPEDVGGQTKIIEQIEHALSGVPDRVAIAVLTDWQADLKQTAPDPDPETTAATALDARIVRQLAAAGVPLTTLSSGLQNRLREALR